MRSRSRNISICAVLASVGIIVSYIETFIVIPVRVPGLRLGLANIATVIGLYLLGPFYALMISMIRVILSAILFGSATSFIYSISGAMISLIAMTVIKHYSFSIFSVSATGAVFHNIAQIIAACFLVSNSYVLMYLPPLMLAGVISGLLIGYLSDILTGRLKNFNMFSESEGTK